MLNMLFDFTLWKQLSVCFYSNYVICFKWSTNCLMLLHRFLSIPKGFSYLNERGYVTKQMEKWQKVMLKIKSVLDIRRRKGVNMQV